MRWLGLIFPLLFVASALYVAYTIMRDIRSGHTTMHRGSGPNLHFSRRKQPFEFWGTIALSAAGVALIGYVGYTFFRVIWESL
ncbi:MAG: hypothetical protein AAF902_12050 [Chloroflexota bacterium]